MSKRLRNQEVTKRPRVIVNGGTDGGVIGHVLAYLYNRDAS